jgi:hypothetical protein
MKSKNLLLSLVAVMMGAAVFSTTLAGTFSVKDNPLKTGKTAHKSGSGLNLNWTNMGPDNVGGKTKAIVVDSRDAQMKTIFAGSIGDGIYKSTTGGLTWHKISSDDVSMNVNCMVQAPNGDIYAGTGEIFQETAFTDFGGIIGHGIFKSTDGNTFTLLESTRPVSNNSNTDWAFINKIAITPGGVVFAATNTGLKLSKDGGLTWETANYNDNGNLVPLSANAYDVDVATDGTVSAVVGNLVYFANDGNQNGFTCVSKKYVDENDSIINPDKLPLEGVGRVEIAFAPSDPNYVYAVAAGDGSGDIKYGQLENVYLSIDKGNTWRIIGPGGSSHFDIFGADNVGCYSVSIAVYPDNPEKFLVGGYFVWEGSKILPDGYYSWELKAASAYQNFEIFFANNNSSIVYMGTAFGILVTYDDFMSLNVLNKTYTTSQFYSVACSGEGTVAGGVQDWGTWYIPGDLNTPQQATVVSATVNSGGPCFLTQTNPKVIIWSNDGSLFLRSDDMGGATYEFLPDSITTPANSEMLFTPAAMWENFNYPESTDTVDVVLTKAINPGDTLLVYSNNQKFPFYYYSNVSLNAEDTLRIKDLVASKFVVGVINVTTASTKGEIYYTTGALNFKETPTWIKLISDVSIVPQRFAFSADGKYLYAAVTKSGNNILYVFDLTVVNDAIIYTTTTLPSGKGYNNVTSITADPSNADNVILTIGGYGKTDYVFRSTNATTTQPEFISVQANLPAMPVYTSLTEYTNGNRVILGTNEGIWSCSDINNPEWVQDGNGMGNIAVTMLQQQITSRPWMEVPYIVGDDTVMVTKPGTLNFGAIYAATFGSGLFECREFVDINDPQPQPVSVDYLNVYPNPVKQDYTTLTYQFDKMSDIQINVFDMNGKMMQTMQLKNQSKGLHNYIINCNGLSNGIYVIKVSTNTKVSSSKFIVVK